MEFKELELQGVYLITPNVFGDNRGFFMETYNQKLFEDAGLNLNFIQDNHSRSAKGTLRGIHYQLPPFAQDKLVRVTQGAVIDVAVDLRMSSDTFGKHVAVELSEDNKQMLLVPKGFGHAFIALTDTVDFQYKVTAPYAPDHDRGIAWDDPALGIDWGVKEPILSEKDTKHRRLSDVPKAELFE
ncbi:dTDP-4-dehydrorhamnose 3,5-epimerase [Candidatus Nomurabacteria bacterium]|nr:dTDP-4-dehydrorhamnose 3,5-epimerase [Candidatus Nomurabacteria bacterium]